MGEKFPKNSSDILMRGVSFFLGIWRRRLTERALILLQIHIQRINDIRVKPTSEFIAYLCGSLACCLLWSFYLGKPVTEVQALLLSSLVGFGPVALAPVVSRIFSGFSSVKPVKMSNLGNLLHIVTGTLFCSVPVTYGCYLALDKI